MSQKIRDGWQPYLSPERQSARMSKIKNGGLDQYGAEPFEQQQFGTAGVGGVNSFFAFCISEIASILRQYKTR